MIDLAFVLDSAGTVYRERWHYVTRFVINIVQQLDVGPNRTRVSVIIWSDTAHVAFELNQFTSRQDVIQVTFTIVDLASSLQFTAYCISFMQKVLFVTSTFIK